MTDTLLQIRDLSIAYPLPRRFGWGKAQSFIAVEGASFDLRPAETFSLVGESGSGKTTIGRAVVRLTETSGGEITFAGQSVTAFGRHTPLSYQRDVQIIFQDPGASLNPRHRIRTILDQVIARHRGLSGQALIAAREDLLDQVQLAPYLAERFPAELSGGQKQRVAIAHALATEPRLVVCDEAVSALDVSTQGQILNLLQDLQDRLGLSYLFISHDLGVVRHVSHRVAVMYRGQIVEIGSAEAIWQAPTHPYTQMLLASTLPPTPAERDARRAERRALRSTAEAPTFGQGGCSFRARCPLAGADCAQRPDLLSIATTHQVACHRSLV